VAEVTSSEKNGVSEVMKKVIRLHFEERLFIQIIRSATVIKKVNGANFEFMLTLKACFCSWQRLTEM